MSFAGCNLPKYCAVHCATKWERPTQGSGRNQGNRDYRQRLPLLVDTRVSYNVSAAFDLVGALTYSPAQLFRSIGTVWHVDTQTHLAMLYTFAVDMVTLSAHFARGYLVLGSDRISIKEAHALTVALGFTYPLGNF